MEYIPNESDADPSMRFEGLARYAFCCERGGGPNNIADAGVFDREFVPNITAEGLRIANEILDSLITKINGETNEELINFKNSLTENMDQLRGVALIDAIIILLKK